jgi:hypothetical protein
MRKRLIALGSATAVGIAVACVGGGGGVQVVNTACPNRDAGVLGAGTIPSGCTLPTPQQSALPLMAPGTEGVPGPTQYQALGAHRVGEVVAFDVPPGTASVTIVEQASVPVLASVQVSNSCGTAVLQPNVAVPLYVDDPAGNRVHDDTVLTGLPTAPQPASLPSFFASDSAVTGTLTIPNTSTSLASLEAARPYSVRIVRPLEAHGP